MRWINHQATGFFMTYAATGDLLSSSLVGAAAIFPDAVELPFGNLVEHRSLSHWPYPYLASAALLIGGGIHLQSLPLYYLGMAVVGCIVHLLEDALSPGGIPLKNPKGPRHGWGLYLPFTIQETGLALTILCLAAAVAWCRGFLHFNYLLPEFNRSYQIVEYLGWSLFG